MTADLATEQDVKTVTLTIDDVEVTVPEGTLVIRAAEMIGVQIPRFCDHPLLDPIGACRQCLVDVPDAGNGRPIPKPQASCTLTVADKMVVRTQHSSPVADKAQQGNMEFLLINHPLDCPVCDKGGECPLQNQAMSNGRGESRFTETKRTFVKPVSISAQVLLDRERCVLCARCTRFSEQIAGDPFIALIERGALQQVGIYEKEPFQSYFSGNTIQICPVGALTSAAYRFRARPFDLVSTPTICEHCASGCALRTDHRRGKVMRRLAGNDPSVNQEWNCDKGRFAFRSTRLEDRLTTPMVRDTDSGEMRPASWTEAFAIAARGLKAAQSSVGVLAGGRLTVEDSYAYGKFARAVLGTNDVDFRARASSAEEADFLAAHVATLPTPTYEALDHATAVVLVGFEPEDESPIVFLRLRRAVRSHGTRVYSVASHSSRGLQKLGGTLLRARPGAEAAVIASVAVNPDVALDGGAVICVGERMATSPGALSAVAALAASTGARLAWVPRRAGERGAVEAGLLPNLLPGSRPLSDASARVDLAAAWGLDLLSSTEGRDTGEILAATLRGELKALVVGAVDIDDLDDPVAAASALDAADFVVSLEVRESAVTARADVILPVAPMEERAGSFVDWEGRVRPFERVIESNGLSDIRALSGVADELGRPLGFRTVAEVRSEMREIGPWDGARAGFRPTPAPADLARPGEHEMVLSTWRTLIDDARAIDGEPHLAATGRRPVAVLSAEEIRRLGVGPDDLVRVSTDAASVSVPVVVGDIDDQTVWLPANNGGVRLHRDLRARAGSIVRVERDGAR
ncbi:MAG: NADH-quinone oxidoreductase subunit [Nocardioidaceae bacterium]|jgi:NADH-quinone oxidoreductase subunit G|nr:NADH-quinone oxidoreductase subunit [Nocardioidaceae bacterium]